MNASTPRPPRLGRWLVALRPMGARRAEIESDLLALFQARVAEHGAARARRRYLLDSLSLWIHRQPARAAGVAPARPRRRLFEGVARDIVFGARLYRRQWGVVALTVGSLGVAIGICTITFSALNAMYLRPLGVADPDGALRIWRTHKNGASALWSYAEYAAARDRVKSVALEAVIQAGVTTGDNTRGSTDVGFASLGFVSGTFFSTFGAQAKVGRLFGPSDDTADAPLVAVVSYYFWLRQFEGDPAIVGRVVRLGTTPVRIVGVGARWFTGPESFSRDFWLPMIPATGAWTRYGPIHASSTSSVSVAGQLAPGRTVEQAKAEVSAVLVSASAAGVPTSATQPATGAEPAPADQRDVQQGRLNTTIGLAAIALVLLLASVNVANLLLASGAGRRREIAVRLALGATRRRLARQLLTESLTLAVLAGGAGLLFATSLTPVLGRLVGFGSDTDMLVVDGRVFAFLAAASLAAGLIAGLAPARTGTKGDLLSPVRGDGTPGFGTSPARRVRAIFVGVQAAASIILLVFAALLARALIHTTTVDLGFPVERIASISLGLPRNTDPALRATKIAAAAARIRALPGVEAAAVVLGPPLEERMQLTGVLLRGGRPYPFVRNLASPEYFSTVGFRFVRGRTFTDEEMKAATAEAIKAGATVAVITDRIARDFWGEADPVGSSMARVDPQQSGTVVVGVIADAITYSLSDPLRPTIYYPLSAVPQIDASIVARTRGPATELTTPIKSALKALNPDSAAAAWLPTRWLDRAYRQASQLATVGALAGGLALALALIGIFGLTSFVIGQRTREIGLRVAIGASSRQVTRLLLRDGLRPVVIGLAVGLLAALAGGQVLAGAMYGVSPRDPIAIGAAVVVLLASGAAAILIPARRAARIDPAQVLRQT